MENRYLENIFFIPYYIISKQKKNSYQKTAKKRENTKNKAKTIRNNEKIQKNKFYLKSFLLFYFINSAILISSLNSSYTEIMITIEGCGEQQLLQNTNEFGNVAPFNDAPDEIYLNNILQNYKSFSVYIDCAVETEINNVTIKWNHLLKNCREMFYYLFNIINIYFLNFDTSSVTDMNCMFYHCESLVSLDLSGFDTSNVTDMNNMFSGCSSLTSLNIKSFNTSKVTNMRAMFAYCEQLKSIDLSSFDTSNVVQMTQMFSSCISLVSLNLFNFDTTKVTTMYEMFFYCPSLVSLNLLNFNTTNQNSINVNNIFYGYNSNLIICMNITKASAIYNNNRNLNYNCNEMCYNGDYYYCLKDECPHNYSKLIYGNIKFCIKNCTKDINYKYEYQNLCYNECPNNTISNNYICEDYIPSTVPIQNTYISESIYSTYIPTTVPIQNTYISESIYSTYIPPTVPIQNTYINETIYNTYIPPTAPIQNTYINETIYSTNIYWPESSILSTNVDTEIIDLKEIIKDKLLLNKNDNETSKDDIVNNVKEILTSLEGENLKEILSSVEEEQYTLFEDETISIFISSPESENNNKYNKMATINLGECENILKQEYNIPNNEPLLIYKINVLKEDMKIPIIEYEIYYPLDGNKLQQLDLSKCNDVKIDLSIPISIEKNDIDKYNSSSDYYNDICYKSTTNFGTDISLQDRKKELAKNDMYACEENCVFIEYDLNRQKAVCSCGVKKNITDKISEINFNSTQLLNSISDVKNTINLNIMKCYNILFNKNGIIKNIGFYIITPLLLFYIISIILFYVREKKILFKKIDNIVYALQYKSAGDKKNINQNKKSIKKNEIKENKKSKKEKVIKSKENNINIEVKKSKKIDKKKKYNISVSSEIGKTKIHKKRKNISINIIQTDSSANKINNNNILNKKSHSHSNNNINKNEMKKIKLILSYNIYEINNLPYPEALKIDKRIISNIIYPF